jgi:hypothetical protein
MKLYWLDGGSKDFMSYRSMIENLADDGTFDEGECDPNFRRFQESMDRYVLVQMYDPEGCEFDVLLKDGEPIGTLDQELKHYDISELETYDQMELREAAEEAARELNYEARLDARRAAE